MNYPIQVSPQIRHFSPGKICQYISRLVEQKIKDPMKISRDTGESI